MRLKNKIAIVVGAGQSRSDTLSLRQYRRGPRVEPAAPVEVRTLRLLLIVLFRRQYFSTSPDRILETRAGELEYWMKPIVATVLLSLVSVGRAAAADLELPAPLPPIAPAGYYRPVNWGGIYFGINGGYGLGGSTWTNAGVSTGSFETNGFLLGGTFGINYAPVGSGFVFGVEGDLDWSSLDGSSSSAACGGLGAPVGAACETKSDWLSTISASRGVCVRPHPSFCHRRCGGRRFPSGPQSAGKLR